MIEITEKNELTEEDLEGVSDFVRTVAEIYSQSSSERKESDKEEGSTS